jgi:predicted  nucleic acid-binding Zn-ribbon protein
MSTSTELKILSTKELTEIVISLQQRITELEAKSQPANKAQKEMTDSDALSILTGEFAQLKHNDAASKTGLSYGQVYSCRLEYTFKHIHKTLKTNPGYKNPWVK